METCDIKINSSFVKKFPKPLNFFQLNNLFYFLTEDLSPAQVDYSVLVNEQTEIEIVETSANVPDNHYSSRDLKFISPEDRLVARGYFSGDFFRNPMGEYTRESITNSIEFACSNERLGGGNPLFYGIRWNLEHEIYQRLLLRESFDDFFNIELD